MSLLCRRVRGAPRIIVVRHDAAAGHFEAVHNHKPPVGDDFRVRVKRDRALGADGQFGHFVPADKDFVVVAREMVSSVEAR